VTHFVLRFRARPSILGLSLDSESEICKLSSHIPFGIPASRLENLLPLSQRSDLIHYRISDFSTHLICSVG